SVGSTVVVSEAVLVRNVLRRMFAIERVPRVRLRLVPDVVQQPVTNLTPVLAVRVNVGALPDDLIAEVGFPEHAVEHRLQVMRGMGVAVEVEGAGRLQDATHLQYALVHPVDIDVHPAFPAVLEAPYLGLVA